MDANQECGCFTWLTTCSFIVPHCLVGHCVDADGGKTVCNIPTGGFSYKRLVPLDLIKADFDFD